MCSYNSALGIPTCASEYLLEEVLREHWNFTEDYHYVVGDCGSVGKFKLLVTKTKKYPHVQKPANIASRRYLRLAQLHGKLS
jgi:beta-glucosidase-like glycosyl hydrolase